MKKIYLSGKMGGLSFEEQTAWRDNFINKLNSTLDDMIEDWEFRQTFSIVNPPALYNYEVKNHDSEREVFEYELSNTVTSDIIVLNLNKCETSVGTLMELGAAVGALKCGKDVKIVSIGKPNENTHPWISTCIFKSFDSIEDCARYVAKYLLI